MIEEKIKNKLKEILKEMGINDPIVGLEHPEDISHGDYSSNVAFTCLRSIAMFMGSHVGENYWRRFGLEKPTSPTEVAKRIKIEFEKDDLKEVDRIEVAGTGFINFFLSREFFAGSVAEINVEGENFGKNQNLEGKKVIVEYTDP